MTDSDSEKESCYLTRAFFAFFTVGIISNLWSSSIAPFNMFTSFWIIKEDGVAWLLKGWPMLLWGVIATVVICYLRGRTPLTPKEESSIFWGGLVTSTWAGIVEEICFRWLIFLNCLWVTKFFNMIFCGFPAWFYMHVVGPIANFFTLGLMQDCLYHPASWAVGASILAANAAFRDGHKYLGIPGIINSWFIGMFLFWITLNYGLVAAIFLHFLYDFLVFTTVYVAAVVTRKLS